MQLHVCARTTSTPLLSSDCLALTEPSSFSIPHANCRAVSWLGFVDRYCWALIHLKKGTDLAIRSLLCQMKFNMLAGVISVKQCISQGSINQSMPCREVDSHPARHGWYCQRIQSPAKQFRSLVSLWKPTIPAYISSILSCGYFHRLEGSPWQPHQSPTGSDNSLKWLFNKTGLQGTLNYHPVSGSDLEVQYSL